MDTLEDYEKVYRACAFFIHKYGRIDWLESLNEYWLPADARLRTDFNIAVGTREDGIGDLVQKSAMKRIFVEAGIPTARQYIVADLPSVPYVMEEFLYGDICTYDAILGPDCEPLFESTCTYAPVIDSVQNEENIHFYTVADLPRQLRERGRKTAKAFGADRRFVHFEFIRITKDYEGIGKAGDYAIMEVNMRPAGGHDPNMMNIAQSADVFRIYAEMVTTGKRSFPESDAHYLCAYAARKDGHTFTHSHEEIMARYGSAIVIQEEMPPVDWPSMGRYVYIARFEKKEEMEQYFAFVLG